MTAIASFLTVTVLSLLVARFQARSVLTGTGLTITEAESIVGHPVRRRIGMYMMLLRNAGLVTAISSSSSHSPVLRPSRRASSGGC